LDRLAQFHCAYTVFVILKLYSSWLLILSEMFRSTQITVLVAVRRFRIKTFSLLHKFNPWWFLLPRSKLLFSSVVSRSPFPVWKTFPSVPELSEIISCFFIFYKIFLCILLKQQFTLYIFIFFGRCLMEWIFYLLKMWDP
jgi:hypothetical protein